MEHLILSNSTDYPPRTLSEERVYQVCDGGGAGRDSASDPGVQGAGDDFPEEATFYRHPGWDEAVLGPVNVPMGVIYANRLPKRVRELFSREAKKPTFVPWFDLKRRIAWVREGKPMTGPDGFKATTPARLDMLRKQNGLCSVEEERMEDAKEAEPEPMPEDYQEWVDKVALAWERYCKLISMTGNLTE